ncbi:alkaline phosphatase-like isoform X2 [Stylophora pistillata]|uniref:alkaline phosphatase-like isoform X2 n=1 Tax=Stylophora pistillata TaxID=50429 RepID=UPI000C05209A|nr:alkaline phosphatase-like isoform X2 [Stylophora pistillata]
MVSSTKRNGIILIAISISVVLAIVMGISHMQSSTESSKVPRRAGVPISLPPKQTKNQWFKDGVKLVRDNLNRQPLTHTAKNTILFLGDGMGVTTTTAARILAGQMLNQSGEEYVLSWEKFPWSALSKTYNVDQQVPDSAGTGTAFLNGVKTNAGVIGVDEAVKRGFCQSFNESNKVLSILTLAEMAGMSTGIVTTTRVTHATPACLYAHSPERGWESDRDLKSGAKDNTSNCTDIALQLIEYPFGDGIEVIFAGGRRELIPNNETDPEYPDLKGERLDGRNLIQEWVDKFPNSQYVWNKTGFDHIDVSKVDHVMGLFEYSHMQYEVFRKENETEPSIEEMTEKAISILKKNPKGYFLLVEGGRIDHGHHGTKAVRALNDAVAMAKACGKASEMTNRAGYAKRGNPIFDLVVEVGETTPILAKDKLPYTVLGYANEPGGERINGTRQDLTKVDTGDKDFEQQATVWLDSETHGGDDVGIYADGPGAYLFHGVVEQPYIFHVMDHAMCLSDSKWDMCDRHPARE